MMALNFVDFAFCKI